MNNFTKRIITAIIFAFIIISSIIINPYTFSGLFLLITIAGIIEFHKILSQKDFNFRLFPVILASIMIYVITFLFLNNIASYKLFWLLVPIISFIFISELYKNNSNPISNISISLFIIIYLGISFSLLNVIAFDNGKYHWNLILSILFMVWTNDTGAYLSGMTFGKHKLFERISPKKTWEGAIGGLIFTLILAYVLSLFWKELNLVQWLIFATIVVVMGVWGDLTESLFKRKLNIKDSGNILPGHGGILDRFDALIMAIPMIAAYLELFIR